MEKMDDDSMKLRGPCHILHWVSVKTGASLMPSAVVSTGKHSRSSVNAFHGIACSVEPRPGRPPSDSSQGTVSGVQRAIAMPERLCAAHPTTWTPSSYPVLRFRRTSASWSTRAASILQCDQARSGQRRGLTASWASSPASCNAFTMSAYTRSRVAGSGARSANDGCQVGTT
jgi:hypothetical protein